MQREGGWNFSDNGYAQLDLVIEVPARLAADIADGSGSIELLNLGEVELTDGSGGIDYAERARTGGHPAETSLGKTFFLTAT